MKRRWLPIIAPLFVLFLLITQLYPSYLWFDSFGLNTIWIKEIQSKLIIFGFGFGIALIWLSAHVSIASRHCRNRKSEKTPPIQKNISQSQFSQLPRKVYRTLKITAVGLLSLFFGFLAKGHWESIILFLNQSPMGSIEPIFNKDISFYLFSIPLFNAIQGWVLTLIIISLIATFWLYLSS
jgi:uncharacterized membrane protein (UPF0182 family)